MRAITKHAWERIEKHHISRGSTRLRKQIIKKQVYMSISQTNMIAKIAAVVAGFGLVAMSFASFAVPAKAATTDVSAQIAALQAQLAALMAQAGGSSTTATFTVDLTVGAKGADVTALQKWLIAKGFSIPAGATGTFGAQTKAAVAAWQASAGITPAAGYFGPKSRAAANVAGGVSTTPGTTPTGLTGAGRLTAQSTLGDTSSDLKVGDATTKVVGVSYNATGGDVAIQRVDATILIGGSGSSAITKYASSVSLYLDGTKIATMDAGAGDKTSRTWTYRFAGLNNVIKSGNTGNLYIALTPVASIASPEAGAALTVTIPANGLRAIAGDGISDTYGTAVANSGVTVNTATNGTLTVTAGSDNPTAGQIAVSSSTTSGVTLMSFNAKAKNQDVKVTDLVVSFGTSDNNLNDVVQTVKLMKGSTVLKSKTVSTGTYGTVTFDGVNQTISKDSTANFTVVADLKGNAAYADGTTLIASSTTAGWDVSDANGNAVTLTTVSLGNTQTLTSTGITVVKGTPTATVSNGLTTAGDIATFAIPFTVTAGDADVFIGAARTKVATAATVPSASAGGVNFATTSSSTSGATGEPTTSVTAANVVTGDVSGTAFKVPAGTSRTFTFNAAIVATTTGATTAGFVGVVLTGINYGPTSTLGTTYYVSNLDTFKTADVYVTKR
jgi:hypothetical protein